MSDKVKLCLDCKHYVYVNMARKYHQCHRLAWKTTSNVDGEEIIAGTIKDALLERMVVIDADSFLTKLGKLLSNLLFNSCGAKGKHYIRYRRRYVDEFGAKQEEIINER